MLLAILANPPLTPGTRTRNRVLVASQLLGFDEMAIGNLFSIPTARTGDISVVGADVEGWMVARKTLESQLQTADGVLLGFGCAEPSGPARYHHREQVLWLEQQLEQFRHLVWWVGGQPRHPSRWQRHTSRCYPGIPFLEALEEALQPRLDVVPAEISPTDRN